MSAGEAKRRLTEFFEGRHAPTTIYRPGKVRESVRADLLQLIEENERLREAVKSLDDAILDVRDAFIRDGTYSGDKGRAIKSMNAAITKARQALGAQGHRP